ncbi:protein TIC 100 isoform X1 [Hevea brasiliensis]|uniref:protein TIC 100 isoform X1 n=1 Tax=Hevea brasiliensis TaxID=3981 RepID=UPI0025DEC333|nr:protein TIC 100 isoform X1 [Hevea brasiliensis]
MATNDSPTQLTDSQEDLIPEPELEPEQEQEKEQEDPDAEKRSSSSSDSDSDSDSDYDFDYDYAPGQDATVPYTRPGDEPPPSDNTPEINIARFSQVLDSKQMKKMEEEEERNYTYYEDLFNFPEDEENWREEDLKELWADAPLEMTKPGWDPVWADEEDWEIMRNEMKKGRDPPIAPFYLPYRPPYPVIPDNHYDISNPKAVIEELDRIEEFLTWVSYIFPDGSSYEGTVWDDLAHGKGVYIAEQGLVRYEGEWLRNNMEGHGVVEVDIPDIEPVPGSKLEAKMRAEGHIISRDFMSPEDRKWLEMDIEDSILLSGGQYEIPFYENDEWIRQFGRKPEKGRYRYAGEWKHGRMHGCGVYVVNERTLYGRFYFGEFVDEATDCDENISALHAGIAEVAAAKARMFVNKPDGMVREERGPYSDPQHPYFYEEEDVWMAPGFVNQFYEVPDYWKRYVQDVDQEREMWLNSFYKAPLRLPMPAELEYWWSNDEDPEFVILNKEPEPDPEDPSKLIYTEDPVILHTKTGRIINYIEDEEHGVRLFWQPPLKDGEDMDPEKVQFLPLGFDEFYGKETVVKKENIWQRLLTAVENAFKPMLERLEKWTEEKKKTSEMKIKLLEEELALAEAELSLEEAIEDMDEELKMQEKEEERAEIGLQEEGDSSVSPDQDQRSVVQEEEEAEDEEDDEDDDITPSSFGSVSQDEGPTKNDQKGKRPGETPFSSCSLSFASSSLLSAVPSGLQKSFLAWKNRLPQKSTSSLPAEGPNVLPGEVNSVSFPAIIGQKGSLKAKSNVNQMFRSRNRSIGKMSLHSLSRILLCPPASREPEKRLKISRKQSHAWLHAAPERDSDIILSLHTQVYCLESQAETTTCEPLSL